jgi:hypothetical protein
MSLNELHAKLVKVARKNPPGDQVPYTFEKRIMSHLASAPPFSEWALWGRPLWRAALSCVAITLLCGVWSMSSHSAPAPSTVSFSQDFEATVYAPLNPPVEDSW